MSKAIAQELRQASGTAVAELGLPTNVTRSLATAISDMGGAELKGPLLESISQSKDRLTIAANMAHIVGTVLTHPHLKLPGNKFDSPQNRQLVREVTAKLVDPSRRLEVSVGLGGSEDAPSLRLPAYISPALDIARAFIEREVEPPTVRIFNAQEVSSSINGLNRSIAIAREVQANDLIQVFTDRFYPDAVNTLSLEPIDFVDVKQRGFAADTAELLRVLRTPTIELPVEEQALQQQLEKLRRASGKHAGHTQEEAETIMCGYAAAHGITFHNYATPGVDGVIKLGGQGEAPFDAIQQHMATAKHAGAVVVSNMNSSGQPQLINLRMKAGLLPPYYLERDQHGVSHELTVDSPASIIPDSIDGIIAQYQAHGLKTGSDFQQLQPHVQADFGHFLQAYITYCQPGLQIPAERYGIMEVR